MVELIAAVQETQTMHEQTSEGNLAIMWLRFLNMMQNNIK